MLFKKKRLAVATTVYWILLAYIIAELGWWFIALQTQNHQMAHYQLQQLKLDNPWYEARVAAIQTEENNKTAQYIGEGSIFLLIILVGAIFVYREVRRQIRLQLQQQNFMMAVTHELKTPIAVAKLNLETLQKHKLDEAKQHKIIQAGLQEIGRLDTLANNILIASQLEGGGYIQVKESLDLSTLVQQSVQDYRLRFPERRWEAHIEPENNVNGDTLLLQMLVNNLVENALKYSPRDGTYHGVAREKRASYTAVRKRPGTGHTRRRKEKDLWQILPHRSGDDPANKRHRIGSLFMPENSGRSQSRA